MKKLVLSVLIGVSCLMAGGLVTGAQKMKFVPGDQVVYEEDFSKCPVGEFPEGFDKFWGAGECVKYNNHIWFAPSTDGDFKIRKKINFGKGEFSIEFDYLIYQDVGYAKLVIPIFMSDDPHKWDKEILASIEVGGDKGGCEIRYYPELGVVERYKGCFRKKHHLALQVRRGQFRIFKDGRRLVSIPLKLKENYKITGFGLEWVEDTNAYGLLVTNIRVARYSKPETKPTPEKLGIGVKKTKEGYKLTMPEKVLFDFNQFILKPAAKEALSSVSAFIVEHPAKKLIVTGYTDNVGSDEYNLKLSLQRAQSVADYLIYCEHLDPKLFKIEGKGKAHPIAPNTTEEGRAKNRRVELRLVE